MTELLKGKLRAVRPRGGVLRFQYNPETVIPSGGGPIWDELDRPLLKNALEWRGQNLRRFTFTLRFDGFPGSSIEADLRTLENFARPRAKEKPPPELEFDYGPVGGGSKRWVIESDLEYADELRRRDLKRVYQEVTVTLIEFSSADVTLTPAERRRRKKDNDLPKVHIVKRGDTLSKIAVRYYGKASRWRDIAKLNGIRDPKNLKVGQRLKLPRA